MNPQLSILKRYKNKVVSGYFDVFPHISHLQSHRVLPKLQDATTNHSSQGEKVKRNK